MLRKMSASRDRWLEKYPGQLCLTTCQMQWTTNCTRSLLVCNYLKNRKPLKKLRRKQNKILEFLSELSRRDLPKQLRLKVNAVITIEIHSRDVIDKMYKMSKKKRNHVNKAPRQCSLFQFFFFAFMFRLYGHIWFRVVFTTSILLGSWTRQLFNKANKYVILVQFRIYRQFWTACNHTINRPLLHYANNSSSFESGWKSDWSCWYDKMAFLFRLVLNVNCDHQVLVKLRRSKIWVKHLACGLL